jgi:hypothetical protein
MWLILSLAQWYACMAAVRFVKGDDLSKVKGDLASLSDSHKKFFEAKSKNQSKEHFSGLVEA